jgi:catechol 2,3-dioxygenase-like lactoylglutathione lyase family enzyme
MKSLLFAVAMVLSSALPGPAQTAAIAAPTPEAAKPNEDMAWTRRAAIVVSDMDRALRLYRDVLGYQLNSLTGSSATSYSYEVFNVPRKAKMRFATFNGRNGQQRSLALLEVKGAALPKRNGIRPIAIVVSTLKLDRIQADIKALGLQTIPERAMVTSDGRKGREWAFLDWDGNLIVMYQTEGES